MTRRLIRKIISKGVFIRWTRERVLLSSAQDWASAAAAAATGLLVVAISKFQLNINSAKHSGTDQKDLSPQLNQSMSENVLSPNKTN